MQCTLFSVQLCHAIASRDEISYDPFSDDGVYCRSRSWLLAAYLVSSGAVTGSVFVMLHHFGSSAQGDGWTLGMGPGSTSKSGSVSAGKAPEPVRCLMGTPSLVCSPGHARPRSSRVFFLAALPPGQLQTLARGGAGLPSLSIAHSKRLPD